MGTESEPMDCYVNAGTEENPDWKYLGTVK